MIFSCLALGWVTESVGQSSFLRHGSPSENLVERYEIRTGNLRNDLFTDIRPFKREAVGQFTQSLDTFDIYYSDVDRYNLSYLEADNLPWSGGDLDGVESPLWGQFYQSRANLFQVNEDGFDLFVNPGLYLEAGPSELNDNLLYTNTRSAEIRGSIDDKVGFYSYISENQIRPPQHEMDFRDSTRSYPGAHFTKSFGEDAVDFFGARGYITFSPTNSISMRFGHGNNFIGSGERSLLLSDEAPDYTFLQINTQIWRFNYQNIFTRLIDRGGIFHGVDPGDPYPPKYAAIHYLSLDILDNLNVGLFESVTFHDNQNRGRGFDVHYANPIIFYRSIEHQIGDPDKMMVGLNMRYLPVNDVEIYGQLMLNEFRLDDLLAMEGHNANKYGTQIGAKYLDALNISNLDLQLEFNRVRPYSYSHYEISRDYPVNTWSHYGQALAHPLGANFYEWIGKVEYQPTPKINTGLRLTHAAYGDDTSGSHWGRDIFRSYRDNEQELGNEVAQGALTQLDIAEGWVSYELWHNLFLEVNAKYRRLDSEKEGLSNDNWFIGTTLRLNEPRRGWDF